MLKINQLHIHRDDKHVLEDFSVEIDTNVVTAIVGPSGCGKSTLLKCLLGFIQAEEGLVQFDEIVFQDQHQFLPIEKRDIGIVFQNLILFEHMTVFENIAYGLSGLNKVEVETRVNEFLKLFNLEGLKDQASRQLSGGEQQRLALARTMAPRPKYLLLDETFSSIDPVLRTKVRKEIKSTLKSLQQGALLVTHDMDDVREFADHVIIMESSGRVVQNGTVDAVRSKPVNDFVRNLLT